MSQLTQFQPFAKSNGIHLDLEHFRSGPGFTTLAKGSHEVALFSYNNISSVIARLRPSRLDYDTAVKPLLINVHLDSAVSSPGVSDILVGVAISLELVRCISSLPSQENALQRPVIFLFNGAEEVGLIGAHSFVTQHPWGRVAAAFINLEASGAGNTFHLFRVGPNSPWLGHAFARAVSVPSASVAATDVFNSRIIPSNTDFSVFTDYAGIPGYDFALVDNPFVYHTVYDDLRHLDPQGVLHGGITTFQLLMELAGKDDAIGAHLRINTHNCSLPAFVAKFASRIGLIEKSDDSQFVFFDIAYIVTVVYGEGLAAVLHTLVISMTILVWIVKFSGMDRWVLLTYAKMIFIFMFAIIGGFALSTFTGYAYIKGLGIEMGWFGSLRKAIIMFMPPAVLGIVFTLHLFLPKDLPNNPFDHMLLAMTIPQAYMAIVLVQQSSMSAYLSCASLLIMLLCIVQGTSVSPMVKHTELMVVHAIMLEKLFTTISGLVIMHVSNIRHAVLPSDMIAAAVLFSVATPAVLMMIIPILTEYRKGLRQMNIALMASCICVTSYFTLAAPLLNDEPSYKGYTPYRPSAPKRLYACHFHSPQMRPDSIVHITSLDAVKTEVDRLVLPLASSDGNIGSLPSVPTFGDLSSTAIEAFGRNVKTSAKDDVFRSGRRPDLAVPVLSVTSEVKTEHGWNVSISINAPESHAITINFAVGESFPVLDWPLETNVGDVKGNALIRHYGSSHFDFWLLLGGDEQRARMKVSLMSFRLGTSRSQNDLAQLNFSGWESPVLFVSSGLQVEL